MDLLILSALKLSVLEAAPDNSLLCKFYNQGLYKVRGVHDPLRIKILNLKFFDIT